MGSLFRKRTKPIPDWDIQSSSQSSLFEKIAELEPRQHERVQALVRDVESAHVDDKERWKQLARKLQQDSRLFPSLVKVCEQLLDPELDDLKWTYMDSARCPHCGKQYPIKGGDFEMTFLGHISSEKTQCGSTTRSKFRCNACGKTVGVIREKSNFD